jgi:hypothetical protein
VLKGSGAVSARAGTWGMSCTCPTPVSYVPRCRQGMPRSPAGYFLVVQPGPGASRQLNSLMT